MIKKQQAVDTLAGLPGATKEEYNGLTIVRYDRQGQPVSAIFHKSYRPVHHYRFKILGEMEEFIIKVKKMHDDQQERSRLYRDRKRSEWDCVKEGSILYYSWGYDQTNIDFFKVVKRKGDCLELVEIEQVRERTEYDGGRCWPIGTPVGDPFKKRIGVYGVRMSCGILSPWDRESIGFTDGR